VIPVITAPQYAGTPLPRAHKPPKARPYAEYRECLRREFVYTCVYCLATEHEVGPADDFGNFEIEHFKPKGDRRFARLRCFYPNLLWACGKCNGVKGDRWPVAAEISLGMYFVDPCAEALGKHLEISGEMVNALTPAGEYMIEEIALNSEVHKYRRTRRASILTHIARLDATADHFRSVGFDGATNKGELEAALATLEQEIAQLKAQIEPSERPWDAVVTCACHGQQPKAKKLTRRERKQRRLAKHRKR
jgi:hypothetical protein